MRDLREVSYVSEHLVHGGVSFDIACREVFCEVAGLDYKERKPFCFFFIRTSRAHVFYGGIGRRLDK